MPLAILPALCVGSLAGADDEDWLLREDRAFVDIRFGLGTVPIPQEYDVHATNWPAYPQGTADYTDHMDTGRATAFSYAIVGGNLQPFGAVYGLELVHTTANQEFTGRTLNGVTTPAPANPSEIQYRTLGGNAMLGVGWQLSRAIHLEALAVGGMGKVDVDFVSASGSRQGDGEGWYWDAGIRAGAYATWHHVVAGVSIEYTKSELNASKHWGAQFPGVTDDAQTTTTSSASGFGGRLEIGYHIQ